MKVKNLVLLGFILSAVSYLSKQVEEEKANDQSSIGELEDIDLEEVKKELGAKLEKAVSEFGDVISAIAKIGSDAFEEFLNEEDDEEEALKERLEKAVAAKEEAKEENEVSLPTFDFDELLHVFDEDDEEEVEEKEDDEEEVEEKEEDEEEDLWHQKEDNSDALLKDLQDTLNSFEVPKVPEKALDEDEMLKDIGEAVARKEPSQELDELFDDLLKDTHNQIEKEVNSDEIDAIFKEIIDQEANKEEVSNKEEEEVKEEKEEDYVRELSQDIAPITPKRVPDVYDQINELYPYLSKSFVRSVYDLKEGIAQEYPCDIDVIVLHRVHFNNIEDLQQFVEIVANHKYSVNVDERKMIVDLFKMYRNTDGKILTNIFEIANQAKLLHGDYEGYRVEVKE